MLKLMYAALIQATEQWRGFKVTALEKTEGEAILGDLDTAHGRRHASPITRARGRKSRVFKNG